MSMLSVHAFELNQHLEQQKKDQVTQEKIARNIEAHASFIATKSTEMRQRLQQAAAKYGYRGAPTGARQ